MSGTVAQREDFSTLLSFLPENWRDRARTHGLLSTHPHAKIREPEDLMQLLLLHVGADLPLRQTVATVAKAGGPSVTPYAVHMKMRRAGGFLQELVADMAPWRHAAAPERWAGYEVLAIDASVCVQPGPTGAGGRLHTVLRLTDMQIYDVRVTGYGVGETLRNFAWKPEQLVLADRGYSNPPGIAHIQDCGADVLVRVNRGALPLYDESDEAIDLLEWARGLEGHRPQSLAAVIRADADGEPRRVSGRLVGVRLPSEKAEQARKRLRREHDGHPDAAALELAGYVLLFTTASAARLPPVQCIEAYRLRWQVELQFKRWKSLCSFDKLPNYRDDTVVSWLYIKVLLALALDRMDRTNQLRHEPTASRPQVPRPLARNPWKLTSILWPAVVAALLPLTLPSLIDRLEVIASVLDTDSARSKPRQIAAYRSRLGRAVTYHEML